MSNDSGKWLPYNLDGSFHECRESTNKKDNRLNQVPVPEKSKPQLKITLTLESLDQRIKNLEESFDMRIKKIEAVLFESR